MRRLGGQLMIGGGLLLLSRRNCLVRGANGE